jgi:hypothetical protein
VGVDDSVNYANMIAAMAANTRAASVPSGAVDGADLSADALATVAAGLSNTYVRFFNVLGYGATGNGTTDDTAAVQAALTAAAVAGGTVFFPAGTYLITSQLTVQGPATDPDSPSWQPGGVHLVGQGARNSILKSNGGFTLLNFTANRSSFCSIEKLSLKGPGKATASSQAALFYQSPHLRLDQVYIRDFAVGVSAYDCTGWSWTDVRTWYCGTGLKLGYNSDSMTFINCEWRISDLAVLIGWATGSFTGSAQYCTALTFMGCIFAYNVGNATTATAVSISDVNADGIAFARCYWEGNGLGGASDVEIGVSGRSDTRGALVTFDGCFHSATVSAPVPIGIHIYGRPSVRFDRCTTDGDSRYTIFAQIDDSTNTQVSMDSCRINAVTAALKIGNRLWNTSSEYRQSFLWAGERVDLADFSVWPTGEPAKRTVGYNATGKTLETWGRHSTAGAVLSELSILDRGAGNVLVLEGTNSAYIAATNVAALPTAAVQLRGCFARIDGGTGVADLLYVCQKSAGDTYSWKLLSTG